ncbi:MAG: hotdog fold thioesterase [Betaproteobacteria bacterium]|jgi:acyl-CoA thioesterase|nr:MAG: hotdog fold thioesterase [Betaproteobacteria bacterium]
MAEKTQKAEAHAVAEEVDAKLSAPDAAEQALGTTLDSISPGHARLMVRVREDMINGAGIRHGGIITALADSPFAFACNSYDKLTLATGITVDFITAAHGDDILTVTADEASRGARTGLYDVTVTN